jgi:hypothetical protein
LPAQKKKLRRAGAPSAAPIPAAIPAGWHPDVAAEVRSAASEIRYDHRFAGMTRGEVRARFLAGAEAALSLQGEPAPYPDPGHRGWLWAYRRMHREDRPEAWALARAEVLEGRPLLRPEGLRYMQVPVGDDADPPVHWPAAAGHDWTTHQLWLALNSIHGSDRRWKLRSEMAMDDDTLAAAVVRETALRCWSMSAGAHRTGYQTTGTAAVVVFAGATEVELSGKRLLDLVRAVGGIRRPDGSLPALPPPEPLPLGSLAGPAASPARRDRRPRPGTAAEASPSVSQESLF